MHTVHAIDNQEGDALQRLIRAMNCKFLALSATVGKLVNIKVIILTYLPSYNLVVCS